MIETYITAILFVLSASGLALPTIDYVAVKKRERFLSPYVTLIVLLITVLALGATALSLPGGEVEIYGGVVRVTSYGLFLALVLASGSLLVTIASLPQVGKWSTSPSFYSLVSLALLGALLLVFVNDLVLLLAAWALMSVASYVIAALKKDAPSAEGALKYSVMGALSSVLMLYGVAVIYGVTGTTNITSLSSNLANSGQVELIVFSLLLFTAAFGFKIGVVPFHGWLPDVYGGVHPSLVAFLAGVVKVGAIGAMLRVITPVAILSYQWLIIFVILSLASMFLGNLVALLQSGVQRMMAYSSIAHVGYILIGLVALSLGPEAAALGESGIAVHVLSYVLAKIGVFVALAYVLSLGLSPSLEGLKGLGKKAPLTSAMLSMLMLNLMGVPPFLGFWGKFYLFISVVSSLPWLTALAIINSAISVGYYAQVIRYMYFVEPEGGIEKVERATDPQVVILAICAILLLLLGLGPILLLAPSLTF